MLVDRDNPRTKISLLRKDNGQVYVTVGDSGDERSVELRGVAELEFTRNNCGTVVKLTLANVEFVAE